MGRSRACQNGNRAPRRLIGFAHAHSRPPGAPPADVLLCELRWGTSRSSPPPCGSVLSFSAAATAVGDRDGAPRAVSHSRSRYCCSARRATGVGADAAAMGSGALAPGQRWSASRKRDVVLRLLRGEPLDPVSREVGVEVYRLERWKTRALAGLELGLKEQAGEPLAAELDAAKRHIGELSMENELLRSRARAAERRLPLATRRSAARPAAWPSLSAPVASSSPGHWFLQGSRK